MASLSRARGLFHDNLGGIVLTLTNIWVRCENIAYWIICEAIILSRFLRFRDSTIALFLIASRFICAKTFIRGIQAQTGHCGIDTCMDLLQKYLTDPRSDAINEYHSGSNSSPYISVTKSALTPKCKSPTQGGGYHYVC